MIKDYFLMALDNLKHRGIRSWLTIIGIFIGIAAVVSLISLGQGLQDAVTGQFESLSPDTLIIQSSSSVSYLGPPGTGAVRKLNKHDLEIIRSVPGVEMAIPRLLRSARVEYNDIIQFKYVTSIPGDPEMDKLMYKTLDLKISQGRQLQNTDRGKIFIGSDFITKDEFDKPVKLGSNIKIQNKSFNVVGIMEKSGTMIVNNIGVISQEELEDALGISDELDMIMVKVVNKDKTEQVAELIKKKMRKDRDEKEGEEDFSVQTPVKALESISLILNIINLVVMGIAIISLLVGGVGIANTMYTSVLERRRDIGVMKAVGSTNFEILKIFVVESGLLGLVGGIAGAVAGLGFAFAVSYGANAYLGQELLKVSVSYPLLLLAILFSFLIGLISGLSPAYQASQLKPVEALRL
jgi:putative ABC transport system permease protein